MAAGRLEHKERPGWQGAHERSDIFVQNAERPAVRSIEHVDPAPGDIDAENVELIEVTVALRAGTPVKTDSVASLQAQGITGLSFIQLSGGT